MKKLTCSKCGLEFKYEITLHHNKLWSLNEQLTYHLKKDCAIFDFSKPINYAFFRPIKDKNVFQPIPGLPDEIGNLIFVYTGETDKNNYLIRSLSQLLLLYQAYHKKDKKTLAEIKYSKIYEKTVINSEIGLCLMIVRSSDNYDEIRTSEFNMIHTFRSHANPLFYNLQDGKNSLNYDYNQSKEMKISNYRRIEFKIKNGYYLKFTDSAIKKIIDCTYNTSYSERSLTTSSLTKDSLENILDIMYKINIKFFKKNREPNENDLNRLSFFERKQDGGAILKRVFSYFNGNWRNDEDMEKKILAYRSQNRLFL